MLRGALLVVSVFTAHQALACAVTVTRPPQTVVRGAAIIAEGTATTEPFTFEAGRLWKGAPPGKTLIFTGPWRFGTSCDPMQPTIPGQEYLILVYEPEGEVAGTAVRYPGDAWVYPLDSEPARELLRVLGSSTHVTRADVLAKLREWHARTITHVAFAKWLRLAVTAADLGEPDVSIVRDLHQRIDGPRGCVALLRERGVPLLLQALGEPAPDQERLDELDEAMEELLAADACAPPAS